MYTVVIVIKQVDKAIDCKLDFIPQIGQYLDTYLGLFKVTYTVWKQEGNKHVVYAEF